MRPTIARSRSLHQKMGRLFDDFRDLFGGPKEQMFDPSFFKAHFMRLSGKPARRERTGSRKCIKHY